MTFTYVGGTSLPCLLASSIAFMSHTLSVVPPSCAQTSFHPSSLVGFPPSGRRSTRRTRGPEKYTLCAWAPVSWTIDRISGCSGAADASGGRPAPEGPSDVRRWSSEGRMSGLEAGAPPWAGGWLAGGWPGRCWRERRRPGEPWGGGWEGGGVGDTFSAPFMVDCPGPGMVDGAGAEGSPGRGEPSKLGEDRKEK